MKFKTLTILSILVFANYASAQTDLIFKASFEFVSRLNDTGITWGGDYPYGNNATCTSNIASIQDCHQGRDATHYDDSDGHAGFSFTKLDANGNSLSASASSWSCVRDNVTGLVWEVKTNDDGIHNNYNTYYGLGSNNWDTLVNGSNLENLCGFDDWRVPNIQELNSIVDIGRIDPVIDINYFPYTGGYVYWSASNTYWTSGPSYCGWVVYFFNGLSYCTSDWDYYVRLVRYGQ